MEDEPKLELSVRGEQFFATRQNTTLFTFYGEIAMFNHVFLELQDAEDENQMMGAYVFCDHAAYQELGNFIVEHNFPMVLNRNDLPECDEQAWRNAHPIEDFVPDWLGEGDEQGA